MQLDDGDYDDVQYSLIRMSLLSFVHDQIFRDVHKNRPELAQIDEPLFQK